MFTRYGILHARNTNMERRISSVDLFECTEIDDEGIVDDIDDFDDMSFGTSRAGSNGRDGDASTTPMRRDDDDDEIDGIVR